MPGGLPKGSEAVRQPCPQDLALIQQFQFYNLTRLMIVRRVAHKRSAMTISRSVLIYFVVLLTFAITLACGSPSPSSMRTPTSITVSPPAPDAANYPNGQVQLTATGFYSQAPSPVTPISVVWGTCAQQGTPAQVSVSVNGMAQCLSGAQGTFPVTATVPPTNTHGTCGAVMACGATGTDCEGVHAAAQLTCP